METAKIFQNGSSQAVRLPKEFRLPGKEVYVRRIGEMVLLVPKKNLWQEWFKNLQGFSDDFMKQRNQPAPQKRKGL